MVTEHLTDAAEAAIGSLSLVLDENTLELVGIRGVREGVAAQWATYSLAGNNPAAEACRTRQMVLAVGLEEIHGRYPELEMAAEGERTLLCLPLLMARRALRRRAEPLVRRAAARSTTPRTCSCGCSRTRAPRPSTGSTPRPRPPTGRPSWRSWPRPPPSSIGDLDYEATLTAVAEAAVPWFADWCAIALEEDGYLRNIAVAHNQPELESHRPGAAWTATRPQPDGPGRQLRGAADRARATSSRT